MQLINSTLIAALFTGLASMTFAGGHEIFEMTGFQSAPTSQEVKQGTTGTLIHSVSSDVWDWSASPDGFPKMVNAECHNSIVIDNSTGAPAGGVGVCELVDLEGDIAVYFGEIVVSASGVSYEGKLSSGTGKYAASVGGQFVGLVTAQMEDGSSIYKVTPK